jgi:hypothetical protein
VVYVDPVRTYPMRGCSGAAREYCHLATDGALDELHTFAASIGLPRIAFHEGARHPHYDLRPAYRARAIEQGAVEVTSKELVRRCFLRR